MKKIVVFGDSYAKMNGSWTDVLGSNLSLPVVNYGYAGSALGYSLLQLAKYTASSERDDSDIIIFAMTAQTRLYSDSMPSPALCVGRHDGHGNFDEKRWHDQNIDCFEWAQVNLFNQSINFETLKILTVLQSWALHHPSSTVIAIQAFPFNVTPIITMSDFVKDSANFVALLNKPTLTNISMDEFVTIDLFNQCVSNGHGLEKRTNHLSECNLILLAEMIANVILYRSSAYYDTRRFNKNLYLTKEDYDHYENPRHQRRLP